MPRSLDIIVALLCIFPGLAWITPSKTHNLIYCARERSCKTTLQAVQTISLKELNNHEEDGAQMAESIAKWLDQEWMPQQVHVEMAESAKKSYIACRENGRDDVMDIMMQVSDDLSADWGKYDADAFVNAFDIANYVSDYLIKKSGNEGCECSEVIL